MVAGSQVSIGGRSWVSIEGFPYHHVINRQSSMCGAGYAFFALFIAALWAFIYESQRSDSRKAEIDRLLGVIRRLEERRNSKD